MTTRILFVCLGNICRSPMAEGILRHRADGEDIEVDSAGTSDWHIGNPPDPRAIAEAARHGVDLRGLRARQFTASDFGNFDLVLAMDKKNLARIEAVRLAGCETQVRLFLDYAGADYPAEVPDPWYDDNFDEVFTMLDVAARGLLETP